MPQQPRHATETWWSILSYLEDRIDPETRSYQVDIATFEDNIGVNRRTLFRYFADMKDLNILTVRRVATDFVAGRQPSVYTLHARVSDLREQWARLVEPGVPPDALDDPEMPDSVRPTPADDAVTIAVLETMEDLTPDETEVDGWLAGVE